MTFPNSKALSKDLASSQEVNTISFFFITHYFQILCFHLACL